MRRPFFKKVRFSADPFRLYQNLKGKGPRVLLESARLSAKTGRYSMVVCGPTDELKARGNQADPFKKLKKILKKNALSGPAGFPPFAGGAMGVVGYEAKRWVERGSEGRKDDLGLPDIHLFFFEEGVVFDHAEGAVYLFAKTKRTLKNLEDRVGEAGSGRSPRLGGKTPLPRGPVSAECSVTRADFLKAVRTIQGFIRKGDIFQANLSQRFSFPFASAVETVYEKLKQINPSPFFGLFDAGDYQILSGSPERLVKLENGILETRPIAGTRARGQTPQKDRALSLELLLNDKERAEHIMLVDLERNDMGRVAAYGSVAVDELMTVEDYSHVKHIVSNVRGVLRKDCDAVDAFKAFFPGGTITGTPKIRCLEILDALEPVARGPYTGSMGYFSFTGNMDWNIIIRSLVVKNGRAHLSVGAGIVADSIPEKEYDETLCKSAGLLAAVFGKKETRAFFEKCGVAG